MSEAEEMTMTNQTQTHTAIQAHPVRTTSFVLRAIGGGLAATSMVLVNLGCGCSGVDTTDWTWGCLVEAEVDGAEAQARADVDIDGTRVRLSSAQRDVTITILGGSLETLPLGEQPVDRGIDVTVCEGDALSACVPVRDAVIEVIDLGGGLARASYSGTAIDLGGREVSAEGTFVFVRGEPGSGI